MSAGRTAFPGLAVCALLLLLPWTGCARDGSARDGTGTPARQEPKAAEGQGAAERVLPDSAWAALVRQLRFGPRVPGTDAHRRCGDWLVGELTRRGAKVEEDAFPYRDPEGRTWPLRNILGHIGPAGKGRLLLVAHWDSRPWADRDPDPARRQDPIPGASDGASGVAVLLEVARVLKGETLPRGIDILFTDGEDLGRSEHPEGFCRGTRHFAEKPLTAYWRAVVLDMVGDADLHLPVEEYSLERAPEVVDWVWERGTALAPQVFSTAMNGAVYDDHMPLLEAGLPAVDVIDIDYPAWHTHADDEAAVSAASLATVARVMASLAASPSAP